MISPPATTRDQYLSKNGVVPSHAALVEFSQKSLSLVICVYNESSLLPDAAKRCMDALSKDFDDFEIVLVDDGSTDSSGQIMNVLSEQNERVKVLHNNINLNLGISLQRGFAVSSKEYILFNSVDLPLEPLDIRKILRNSDEFDVLVLERKSYQGATSWRKVTSKINRLALQLLFPIASSGLRDLNFTLICRREILSLIMPISRSPAFTQPEMILRARYRKLRVEAMSVDYYPRPTGKGALGKPHDILWTLYDMSRFRLKSWTNNLGKNLARIDFKNILENS